MLKLFKEIKRIINIVIVMIVMIDIVIVMIKIKLNTILTILISNIIIVSKVKVSKQLQLFQIIIGFHSQLNSESFDQILLRRNKLSQIAAKRLVSLLIETDDTTLTKLLSVGYQFYWLITTSWQT